MQTKQDQEKQIKSLSATQQGWQMLKFTLFSASAGIIQILSFTLLNEVFHLRYWLGYGIALVLSVLWNFTFNRRYTFRSDENISKAMSLVFLYYIVFTPLSTWWGEALTRAGWNEYIVLFGTMVINLVTEFSVYRFIVFRNHMYTNKEGQAELAKQQSEE